MRHKSESFPVRCRSLEIYICVANAATPTHNGTHLSALAVNIIGIKYVCCVVVRVGGYTLQLNDSLNAERRLTSGWLIGRKCGLKVKHD